MFKATINGITLKLPNNSLNTYINKLNVDFMDTLLTTQSQQK